MLESVRTLADLLARDGVTVEDLVTRLGGESDDTGANVRVHPTGLPGIVRADVVRMRPGVDVPAHVELELEEPEPVQPLEAVLGQPARVHPDHRGQPVQLVYPIPLVDGSRQVKLIAEEADGGPRTLVLRRD
ncbi:MAG TPA: hypothetical protein VJ741_15435 [Solirubrobacteraceae bacterium]|nr:hypothetical protein [Solirubrobacteraceae bacterium]